MANSNEIRQLEDTIFKALAIFDEFGSGGILSGGTSNPSTTRDRFGEGGATVGGCVRQTYDEVTVGGCSVGGCARQTYNETASGGVLASGFVRISHIDITVGGVGVSGFARINIERTSFFRPTFDITKDLISTYSGGGTNGLPSDSLGGEASPVLMSPGLNNLFDDTTQAEVNSGKVDYRCFYIFNDHIGETVYNIKSWIDFEVNEGSDIKLGVSLKDELQSVVLDAVPDYGFFTVQYEPSNPLRSLPVKVDRPLGLSGTELLDQFSLNFQNALRTNPDLRDVSVKGFVFGSGISFEVLFEKLDGKRQQENLVIVINELSPDTNIFVNIIIKGSPINTVAAKISTEISPPPDINFSYPNISSPFTMPKLREGEGFHIWVERTVVPGAVSVVNDGFHLGRSAEPIEPEAVA